MQAVRRQEGLALRSGLAWGEAPPSDLEIREHGLRFQVDLLGGQKTGFYVDQRENRRIVGAQARGRRVLNAFSFTGAFGVYALAGGAEHVTNIDTSFEALTGAEAALRLNGFDPDRQSESIGGDVFQVLRAFRDEGRQFDLVILDPPKFARSKAELDGATRGYKDINLLGLKLLAPGGLLATFSCSGLVTPDLFQKIVFGASIDAGRRAQIIAKLGQGPDHPDPAQLPGGRVLERAVVPGGVDESGVRRSGVRDQESGNRHAVCKYPDSSFQFHQSTNLPTCQQSTNAKPNTGRVTWPTGLSKRK